MLDTHFEWGLLGLLRHSVLPLPFLQGGPKNFTFLFIYFFWEGGGGLSHKGGAEDFQLESSLNQ